MKRIKILVLVFLVIGFFKGISFAGISSRVQGNVIDDQTGIPIDGALVHLIIGSNLPPYTDLFTFDTKTDSKGYFKFDLEPNDIAASVVFSLRCEKKGYIPFLPEYYRMYVKNELYDEVFKVFRLKEGQIKHFNIGLKKGGVIEGTLFKKTAAGIVPLAKAQGVLMVVKEKFHTFFEDNDLYLTLTYKTDDNGKFRMEEVEPFEKYSLSIRSFGYRTFKISNISAQSGQVTPLEYICDMTDRTGVEGVVKVNTKSLWGGEVTVYSDFKNAEGKVVSQTCHFGKNGVYACIGLLPGVYTMVIEASSDDMTDFKKKLKIEIVSGITKKVDANF